MGANRTGKREREARNRHKRCMATVQIDGVWLTLKLGRKKENALSQSDKLRPRLGNVTLFDYLSPSHRVAPWAVPVADSRTPVQTDEGDANVSEPGAIPAHSHQELNFMFTSQDKLIAHALGVALEDEAPDFLAVCRWLEKARGMELMLLLYLALRRLVSL
jgi:hypothetical protein